MTDYGPSKTTKELTNDATTDTTTDTNTEITSKSAKGMNTDMKGHNHLYDYSG